LFDDRPLSALTAAVAVAATLWSAGARAEDPKAQAARSFHAGSEAYAHGEFPAAARAFDEAYRIAPRGAAAYNAGLAWERAQDRRRAADDYTRALEASDLGAAERADATGRLRALEGTLGQLTITAPAGTRLALDDAELPAGTTSAHVEPGPHVLRVDYPGGKGEVRTVVARAGVEQSLKLGEAATATASAEPVAGGPASEPAPATEESAPPPHHEPGAHASSSPDRTAVWLTFGGAAVSAGVAVTLYALGVTARNQFVSGGEMSSSEHSQAVGLRTGTWVAWSVAGALAVTGVVLYLASSEPSSTSQRAASPTVALDSRGVTVRVPF
jgi:hypothetical protein